MINTCGCKAHPSSVSCHGVSFIDDVVDVSIFFLLGVESRHATHVISDQRTNRHAAHKLIQTQGSASKSIES